MSILVLCGTHLGKKESRAIKSLTGDSLIVVTEKSMHDDIKRKYPEANIKLINIFAENELTTGKDLSEKVVHVLEEVVPKGYLKTSPIIYINGIYEIFTRVIAGLDTYISSLIDNDGNNEIILMGGNNRVAFYPMNLAEGERLFRFMYRREWFLNPILNMLFKHRAIVHWYQEPAFYLRIVRWLRIQIINVGKILKSIRKYQKSRKQSTFSENSNAVGIVVRTKPVISAMVPVYHAIRSQTKYRPVIFAYENYANDGLIDEIEKHRLEFEDLRKYATIWSILKSFFHVMLMPCHNKSVEIDGKLSIETRPFVRELKVMWWESELMCHVFSEIRANRSIKCLVNAETYNWVAATQGCWSKINNVPIVSIQFVTLRIGPRNLWVDKYFLMTRKELEHFVDADIADGFSYIGPICYDYIFNSTTHKDGTLNNIVIFTQPDSLHNESLQIVDDLLGLRQEMGMNWDIIIKLHPREKNIDDFRKKCASKAFNSFARIITDEEDSTELLQKCDLAVGIASTTLYQAVLVGTPAVSVNYGDFNRFPMDIFDQGVVKRLADKKEIRDFLGNFNKNDEEFKAKRNEYIEEYMDEYDGKGAVRLANYIKDKLK